jgi:hypothetical protein
MILTAAAMHGAIHVGQHLLPGCWGPRGKANDDTQIGQLQRGDDAGGLRLKQYFHRGLFAYDTQGIALCDNALRKCQEQAMAEFLNGGRHLAVQASFMASFIIQPFFSHGHGKFCFAGCSPSGICSIMTHVAILKVAEGCQQDIPVSAHADELI